jgi:hypothetical protein
MKKSKELVSSRNPILTEHAFGHQPKLVTSDTRILATDFRNDIYDAVDPTHPFLFITLLLIISLTGMAKQTASGLYREVIALTEAFYCLAPDFFRIWMPCSSAISISVSRALHFN